MLTKQTLPIPPLCSDGPRLEALRRYGILDTPPELAFDDITRVIAHICQTPVAMVNFIDEGRQFFKSEIGLGVRETPLDISICAQAILERDRLLVPDTTKDPRFAGHPLVTGPPHFRSYAGSLLQTADGHPIGTLCVMDYVPREFNAAQIDALQALARQVMTQLELRHNVTAQSRMIEDRERVQVELEKSAAAKDQFLAELSHELRTPLNPVLMTASSLARDPKLPNEYREDMRIICRNVELEVRLIDDLLDLTRISRGKVELRRSAHSAQADLQATIAMYAGDLDAKRLRLVSHLDAPNHLILADTARLHQVFANLLRNAIKFTPEGGTITVATRNADQGDWILQVQDSGIGIEPFRLGTVFNAYEQGDRSITRRFGGLGLGLAITKALVEMHGGSIAAASEGLGCGATFTVALPTVIAAIPVAAVGAALSRKLAIQNRRVLLVEDNETTARVMARLLRQMSHQVETAGDIASAIRAAEAEPFDLLISDVGLPDGSGLDLMRRLKEQYGIAGIAVTGYGMEEDIESCREAGFLVHLTKPISSEQLDAAIAQVGE